MNQSKANIILTVGEPAGIGPDIVIGIADHARSHNEGAYTITAMVAPALMDQRAQALGSEVRCVESKDGSLKFGHLTIDARHSLCVPVKPGHLDVRNAQYVYDCIESATTGCLSGRYAAMVTAPVHKGLINESGIAFSGHTEMIANLCGVKKPVMMLAKPGLRVALLTTHLPLRQVPAAITSENIQQLVSVVHQALKSKFGIHSPRILVCGLNPHAGEDGYLGCEEIEVITPCLEKLRQKGMNIIGPAPADTAFTPHMLAQVDIVIAMYHDQGLPVIKAQGFGETVNITLGLPIIRTSVDHGTALELAASGRAESSSLMAAIELAFKMHTDQG